MATLKQVRGINRSQMVRIFDAVLGTEVKLSPTVTNTIDIDDAHTRRQYQQHSAIGAIQDVPGGTSASTTVFSGGVVTAGSALSVSWTAGELRTAATPATYVAFAQALNQALAANASGNPRIDLVSVTTTGTVQITTGTAAASPVVPNTPAGNTPLAKVAVANAASAPGTITDLRPRY